VRVGRIANLDGIALDNENGAEAFVQGRGEIGGRRGKSGDLKWKHAKKTNAQPSFAALRRASYPTSNFARETVCIRALSRYFPRSLMAKTSWINRNERKRATVKKYAALRAELKAKKDYMGLSQLPRDASPTRVVNRCEVSGRRRAFIRRFKISRLTFRELASGGFIPGVTKSSW
jgi:small subunit ribosomal protein S14